MRESDFQMPREKLSRTSFKSTQVIGGGERASCVKVLRFFLFVYV